VSLSQQRRQAHERERRAWIMSVEQGMSTEEIARELAVDERSVRRYLQKAEKRAQAEFRTRAGDRKEEHAVRIYALIQRALRAYDLSKKPKRIAQTVERPGPDGKPQRVYTVREMDRPEGDPRFLAEVRGYYAELHKLLGLYAPTKIEQTANKDRPLEELGEQELRERIKEAALRMGLAPGEKTH